ncbi:MAG: T9SS type A sorting domain-containing protein [Cytophagaceae bacterium]
MKKLLLSISAVIFAAQLSAQVTYHPATGTPTGLNWTGNIAAHSNGSWGSYTPLNSDDQCTQFSPAYLGGKGEHSYQGPADGEAGTNQIKYVFSQVQPGYQNFGTCGAANPSFSFNLADNTKVFDLSNPDHRKLTVYFKSDMAFQVDVNFFTKDYWPPIITSNVPKLNILGDNQWHAYTVDFSTSGVDAALIDEIFQLSFIYSGSTPLTGELFARNLSIGSAPVLSTNKAASYIASSNLYPNPATGSASFDLNLKEVSTVKVIITDLAGKEAAVVFEGNMTAGNNTSSFDVSALNKGMYSVNYFINGEAAKAQLLMVK